MAEKTAGTQTILSIDLETYSSVDLGKCGVYKYCESEDFEILLFAYAFDDEEVQIIDMACGEELPQEIIDAIESPDIIKAAWNAQFERTCLSRYLGHQLFPDFWRCSMVHAASLSLPLSLKEAAKALKTGEQKDRAGEALIRKFSVPKVNKNTGAVKRTCPKDDPEGWQMFKDYCLQDVRTERDIHKKIERFPMPDTEWDFYHMDQRINDRGVLIDMELVEQAITCDLTLSDEMSKRAYELTGLENPNSVSQLKMWLEERGIDAPSLGKKEVAALITELDKNSVDQEALDMLKLRLQMAKSSVKKYQAAERAACKDGRARGLFQFNGANRTGRWSGRLIQLQNLPQNHIDTLDEARDLVKMGCFELLSMFYGNTPDILSQLIRTMLIPKPGCEFRIADYSAVEARVLAWEAGEQWRLDAFRDGKDIYCESASQMFHVPVVKHGINGDLRQKGKVAELACGYQGGAGALISMGALDMGLKESELQGLIDDWREANPAIVKYWWDVEKAATETVKTHEDTEVGRIRFEFYGNALWMVLPSGRKLAYLSPKLQPNRFGRMSLTFMGVGTNNKWSRQETYGGKLVENATQAIARDLLAEAMLRIEKAGYDIVGSVHDEVIVEAPIGVGSVEELCSLMSESPKWCPDLLLNAAGYSGQYYFKD
ncbi:MAG: DNA polymerase [Clostridiales bacterium]|nr:DNA polymerase [Clostridiales bacterium]